MADHKRMVQSLGFNSQIQSSAVGNSGGIFIMWDNTFICVQDITIHPQGINVEVKVSNPPSIFLFSSIHANTNFCYRLLLWDHLCNFFDSHISPNSKPMLIGDDFNEFLRASKKFRGSNIKRNRVNAFWNCINYCSLDDLGFNGRKFTWTNKRYSNRRYLILVRLVDA